MVVVIVAVATGVTTGGVKSVCVPSYFTNAIVLGFTTEVVPSAEAVPDVKNGKVVGSKRERNTFQTEITLTGEDVKRFNNLANK